MSAPGEFEADFFVSDAERQAHPMRAAQAAMKKPLPKRFYTSAGLIEYEGQFRLALDGKGALTPAKRPLCAPTRAAGDLLTAEWNAIGGTIDPAVMPVTRMVNAAIDHVAQAREAVIDDILRYARSDLLCYRAGEPAPLVARQNAVWNPLVAWAGETFGAAFRLTEGIVFVDQPADIADGFRTVLTDAYGPIGIAAMHVLTTLSGSIVLAVAVAERRLDPAEAFAASELDADFEAEIWGYDSEAIARRNAREADFLAAARLLAALA
jgi:chaperone required for assembly of F1-ATPase